jgi:hypothetical protein
MIITQVSHLKIAKKPLVPQTERNLFLSASGGKVKYLSGAFLPACAVWRLKQRIEISFFNTTAF